MEQKKTVVNQSVTASMTKIIPMQDYDELPVACPGEPGTIELKDAPKSNKKSPKEGGG